MQANLTYHPDGQINTVSRWKWSDDPGTVGVTSQYGYDQAGRKAFIHHMLTEGWGLTYTHNGNQVGVTGALMAFFWQYNADGQIIQSNRGASVGAWDTNIQNQNRSYSYDPAGQLIGVATDTSRTTSRPACSLV